MRTAVTVDTETPLRITVNLRGYNQEILGFDFLGKPRALLKKVPGYFMSSYKQFAYGSPVFTNLEEYERLMKMVDKIQSVVAAQEKERYHSYEVHKIAPKQNLFVRMKSGLPQKETELMIDTIRNLISDDTTIIVDVMGMVNSTQTAVRAMIIFFNIVALVNSMLCFFLLWLSFDTNVRENSWEFGVLRAIGLNASQVLRVYIYEALAIVFSALLLGTSIGIITSISLTLQFNLFSELPFSFDFSYVLYFSVVAVSITVAILGAYLPTNELKKKEVAIVLRGGG